MHNKYAGLPVRRIVPLFDKDYFTFVLSSIRNAHWRVWASIFIVDVLIGNDKKKRVRTLLKSLEKARKSGIDVRLLIGDSKSAPGIRYKNMVARAYTRRLGIRTRRHTGAEESSSHDKYVLIDSDCLIVGSHNWTNRAFSKSNEDSVALYSEEMNILKTLEFHRHWIEGVER